MDNKTVLWVDDDQLYIRPIIEDLRDGGLRVVQIPDADEAFETVVSGSSEYSVILLDIMMPPTGIFASEDTAGGLRTGVNFLKRLAEVSPENLSKIIVASVSDDPNLRKLCDEMNIKLFRKATLTSEVIMKVIFNG